MQCLVGPIALGQFRSSRVSGSQLRSNKNLRRSARLGLYYLLYLQDLDMTGHLCGLAVWLATVPFRSVSAPACLVILWPGLLVASRLDFVYAFTGTPSF